MKLRTEKTEIFEHHRGRRFGLAYRMLGSRADANDAPAIKDQSCTAWSTGTAQGAG
jgi:hypothetical protein